jgi:F-type H+-transporting ATPase subunit b
MEIISTNALISINGTLIAQLVSFLIYLFILNRIMFRPLQGVMDERESFIEKIKLDTDNKAKEFERLNLEMKALESDVRKEAFGIRRELEEGGVQEASVILESTRQEIESIKEKMEAKINAQISDAKKHLQKESEALAVNVMEKLLDRGLTP